MHYKLVAGVPVCNIPSCDNIKLLGACGAHLECGCGAICPGTGPTLKPAQSANWKAHLVWGCTGPPLMARCICRLFTPSCRKAPYPHASSTARAPSKAVADLLTLVVHMGRPASCVRKGSTTLLPIRRAALWAVLEWHGAKIGGCAGRGAAQSGRRPFEQGHVRTLPVAVARFACEETHRKAQKHCQHH